MAIIKRRYVSRIGFAFIMLLLHSTNMLAQNSNVIVKLTRYHVKPEQQTAFRKAAGEYVRHTLTAPGNVLSEAYYEQENPTIHWTIERWSDKGALDNISKSAPCKALDALASKALTQPPKIIYAKDLEPLSQQQWRHLPDKADQPLTIMLFVDSKPGTENKFKQVYHTAMPGFRSEPGVINYQLSQLDGDSTQFVTYEKFRNEEAFQYHLKFPPIQPVIDYLNTSIKKQPFQAGLHRLIAFATLNNKE